MFKNVKGMTEKKNDLITRAESLVNTAENENRELTPDEMAELAEIHDDVRKIKEALAITGELDAERETAPVEPAKAEEGDRACDVEKAETRAFENYIRGVVTHERDAVNLTKADNGAIIPTAIAKKIIKKVYDISPLLEKSEKYNVKGTLQIPYYDTATTSITVAFADEFSPLASSVGNFTSITLTGFLAGALTKVSNSLINNAQFDVVGFVVNQMSYDIARFIENILINGATKTVSGETVTTVAGLSTISAGSTSTSASATAITADEIVTLKGMVKDVYQANAIWIMSPATRNALRLLKDDVGRYLLNDDITSPFGTTLLGKPVYVSDNMPEMTAGNKAIFYGDMSGLATKFSEEVHVQVLREKYADEHATGVIGWFEFDAKIQDAQKIVALKMHS